MSDIKEKDIAEMTEAELFEKFVDSTEEQVEPQAEPQPEPQPEPEAEVTTEVSEATVEESKAQEDVYEPNYTFKVLDEEKEFDERVRGFIKSKEDEEYFRDLYTKAYGLEAVKSKSEKYKEEITKYQSEMEELSKVKEDYSTYKQALDSFEILTQQASQGDKEATHRLLDVLGVNQDQLARVLAERLQWTPEQMQARQAQHQQMLQQQQVHQQQAEFTSQKERLAELETRMGITAALQAPQISDKASRINELLGGGDALFNEIWQEGYRLNLAGQDPTFDQVAEMVVNKYSKFIPTTQQSAPQQAAPQPKPVVQKPANVIPNVSGNSETVESKVLLPKVNESERDFWARWEKEVAN